MKHYYHVLLISPLVSLLAVRWVFMYILKIAKQKDLVDKPGARKLQTVPVPVLGGLAVFFGLLAGLLTAEMMYSRIAVLLPAVLAASVMLYVGAIDDMLGLSPRSRLIIEVLAILAMCLGSGMWVDSLHGLWGIYDIPMWIGVPLTLVAGVGIVNAFNMVDGVNGLASGLSIAICTMLGIFLTKIHDVVDGTLVLCYGASLTPFLMHNVFGKKSKMFLGDSGTMVMGILVTWSAIRVMCLNSYISVENDDSKNIVAVMLAIASVPVFDTLRVMTMRMMKGESPFKADKTHLHHKFIAAGVSHSITALCEIALDLLVVLAWLISYLLELGIDMQFYVTVVAAVVLVWGTFALLEYHESHKTAFYAQLNTWSVKTHLGHRQWWLRLQHWLDKGAYSYEDMDKEP